MEIVIRRPESLEREKRKNGDPSSSQDGQCYQWIDGPPYRSQRQIANAISKGKRFKYR